MGGTLKKWITSELHRHVTFGWAGFLFLNPALQ